MAKMCDEGKSLDHNSSLYGSRRDFLRISTTTAVAAAGLNFIEPVWRGRERGR